MTAGQKTVGGQKRLLKTLSSSMVLCREPMLGYGACLSARGGAVAQGDCQREFEAMRACLRTAMTASWKRK